MVKRENRKYTADEIIYEIKRCGNTKEEIYAVYDLIENAEMDEDELEKLIQSGYTDVIYQVHELLQDD